jgi:hypothetical protein
MNLLFFIYYIISYFLTMKIKDREKNVFLKLEIEYFRSFSTERLRFILKITFFFFQFKFLRLIKYFN